MCIYILYTIVTIVRMYINIYKKCNHFNMIFESLILLILLHPFTVPWLAPTACRLRTGPLPPAANGVQNAHMSPVACCVRRADCTQEPAAYGVQTAHRSQVACCVLRADCTGALRHAAVGVQTAHRSRAACCG